MQLPNHDPYLNTAKRTIQNKKYKGLYQEKHKHKDEHTPKSKSFFSQKVDINRLLNLSEGTMNLILFIAFLVIPYTVGIAFIFVVIAKASLDTFKDIHTNEYALYWAIGYEVIALIIILLVIKSAIRFHSLQKKSNS